MRGYHWGIVAAAFLVVAACGVATPGATPAPFETATPIGLGALNGVLSTAMGGGTTAAPVTEAAPATPASTATAAPTATAASTLAGPRVAKIAFVATNRKDRIDTIMLVDPDGQNLMPLISADVIFFPVWSPDGTQIAFVAGAHQSGGAYDVWVMNSDRSNLHKVSGHMGVQYPGAVVWFPDSRRLIYSYFSEYGIDLYTVNADGTGEEKIPLEGSGIMDAASISLSPDGAQLAYLGFSDSSSNGQIMTVGVDGAGPKPLETTVNGKPRTFSYLVWSPDGKSVLLYNVLRSSFTVEDIYQANPDGSEPKTLVRGGQPAPFNLSGLSVAPDGSGLAFLANDPSVDAKPPLVLFVAGANGASPHVVRTGDIVIRGGGTSWGMIPASLVPTGAPPPFTPSP